MTITSKAVAKSCNGYAEAVGSCITCIAWRCEPHPAGSLAAVDTERPELTWRSAAHNHVSQDSLATSSCDLFQRSNFRVDFRSSFSCSSVF